MVFIKFVGLALGFCALWLPSLRDKNTKLKTVSIIIAGFLLVISGIEIWNSYQAGKKINPSEINFTITYSCHGIYKEEDIFKLCPETFSAPLVSPKGTLLIHFERMGNISHTKARYTQNSYYVAYKSTGYSRILDYNKNEDFIRNEDEIKGKEIILEIDRSLFENKLREYLEKEELRNDNITYKFDCTLNIKDKEYTGNIDNYYSDFQYYGVVFKIDK